MNSSITHFDHLDVNTYPCPNPIPSFFCLRIDEINVDIEILDK